MFDTFWNRIPGLCGNPSNFEGSPTSKIDLFGEVGRDGKPMFQHDIHLLWEDVVEYSNNPFLTALVVFTPCWVVVAVVWPFRLPRGSRGAFADPRGA